MEKAKKVSLKDFAIYEDFKKAANNVQKVRMQMLSDLTKDVIHGELGPVETMAASVNAALDLVDTCLKYLGHDDDAERENAVKGIAAIVIETRFEHGKKSEQKEEKAED